MGWIPDLREEHRYVSALEGHTTAQNILATADWSEGKSGRRVERKE